MICVALGIEGMYDDPDACLSSVIQTYKNFTAGWQWNGHEQINGRVTLSTSNVSLWVAVTAPFLIVEYPLKLNPAFRSCDSVVSILAL